MADVVEIQPDAFVTVYVYVPDERPVIVEFVPVPVVVIPPGVLVKVQVPVTGKPFKTIVPDGMGHVGWVIVPAAGADGVGAPVVITTLDDDTEIQPDASVTVYVYVPAGMPDMVELTPVPVVVTKSTDLVNVQVPAGGRPLKTTLPVSEEHLGWVMTPGTGADG